MIRPETCAPTATSRAGLSVPLASTVCSIVARATGAVMTCKALP
ncbi:hypothetical protein QWZ10_03070 [Paracoccus cavernae]|uniref:Uncharacterized protein n=1 Tax=Paracoccus cavernae TaxID=1571207 RepID=A0ABT8D719_9RHOB|nr:hypothetical protein [Paracoccus cavernae]